MVEHRTFNAVVAGSSPARLTISFMDLPEYIEIRPDVMMGKPCIQGTRIPVYLILEKLAAGETSEQILAFYPQLKKDQRHFGPEVCGCAGERRNHSCLVKFLLDENWGEPVAAARSNSQGGRI